METNQTDEQGRKQGLWERLHDNGNIWWRENYCDDKLHWLSEWFHEDGTLQFRVNYRNGEPHGLCEWFNYDGQLESLTIF